MERRCETCKHNEVTCDAELIYPLCLVEYDPDGVDGFAYTEWEGATDATI